MGILNVVYADSGPTIGANQAKTIAQNYLNSHNLPYTAITPGDDAWKAKVRDTKTGAEKWISVSELKEDFPEAGGSGRYEDVPGYNYAWVVQVNDKSGKNVGRIYVDSENGKILKPIINQGSQASDDASVPANGTNSTDGTNQTSPGSTNPSSGSSGNSTGIILATAFMAIVIGAGYWIYSRK